MTYQEEINLAFLNQQTWVGEFFDNRIYKLLNRNSNGLRLDRVPAEYTSTETYFDQNTGTRDTTNHAKRRIINSIIRNHSPCINCIPLDQSSIASDVKKREDLVLEDGYVYPHDKVMWSLNNEVRNDGVVYALAHILKPPETPDPSNPSPNVAGGSSGYGSLGAGVHPTHPDTFPIIQGRPVCFDTVSGFCCTGVNPYWAKDEYTIVGIALASWHGHGMKRVPIRLCSMTKTNPPAYVQLAFKFSPSGSGPMDEDLDSGFSNAMFPGNRSIMPGLYEVDLDVSMTARAIGDDKDAAYLQEFSLGWGLWTESGKGSAFYAASGPTLLSWSTRETSQHLHKKFLLHLAPNSYLTVANTESGSGTGTQMAVSVFAKRIGDYLYNNTVINDTGPTTDADWRFLAPPEDSDPLYFLPGNPYWYE